MKRKRRPTPKTYAVGDLVRIHHPHVKWRIGVISHVIRTGLYTTKPGYSVRERLAYRIERVARDGSCYYLGSVHAKEEEVLYRIPDDRPIAVAFRLHQICRRLDSSEE